MYLLTHINEYGYWLGMPTHNKEKIGYFLSRYIFTIVTTVSKKKNLFIRKYKYAPTFNVFLASHSLLYV